MMKLEKKAEDSRILREQVDLLYGNALAANLTVIAVAFVYYAIVYDMVDHVLLTICVASLVCTALFRLFLRHRYISDPQRHSSSQWAWRYTLGTLLVGIAWGGPALLMGTTDNILFRGLTLLIILVVIATAPPVLSSLLNAFYAYTVPPSLMMVVIMILDGSLENPLPLLAALGIAIYTLLQTALAVHAHRHISHNLHLQFHNQELISCLHKEIDQRKHAQLLLKRHGEQLEEQIEERTEQLILTNQELQQEMEERRRIEEDLKHLAHHDALTDLPNRLLLEDRLKHAIDRAQRAHGRLAVMFLDLDHFKHINDSLGHALGDELLRQVSSRLSNRIRKGDTVARLGGDEFIIVMEQIEGPDDVDALAQELMVALRSPFNIQGHRLFVDCSIGISMFPQDGEIGAQLLKNADAAMYQSKEDGRNNYSFYNSHLTESSMDRINMVSSLRQALEQQELEVHYQPQVSLPDRQIVSAEALIRWNHPDNGLLLPARFLALAEESGLIVPIGLWVLRTACQQMSRWKAAGLPIQRVAVNLAGKQIRRADLLLQVREILQQTGCRPEWLELEITEGFIMRETDSAIQILHDLRRIGVHLAIDDFGTGYSSLSHLKRLPIDRLKIDRSFIRDLARDPSDAAITRAVIALGTSLKLEITAEGVENAYQERFLVRESCHQAQGFRYGRPMPAQKLRKMLERELQGHVIRAV